MRGVSRPARSSPSPRACSPDHEGDEPIEVDARVWALFNNARVRQAIERIIRPLKDRGIDVFKIRHKGKETLEVKENEAPYFDAPAEHEGKSVSVSDLRVAIVSPSFQKGNKWRVSDGSRTIFVGIEDPACVRAVQKGDEAFRKGDVLQVSLQTRQWMEAGELKVAHSIVKVHRSRERASAGELPLSQDDQQR